MTRVGKVWQIIQVTSINPRATRAHLGFYQSVVHKDSSLSPLVRETLAITVSEANGCDTALTAAEQLLCEWAIALTINPGAMVQADVDKLRDAAQGLGVNPESGCLEMPG